MFDDVQTVTIVGAAKASVLYGRIEFNAFVMAPETGEHMVFVPKSAPIPYFKSVDPADSPLGDINGVQALIASMDTFELTVPLEPDESILLLKSVALTYPKLYDTKWSFDEAFGYSADTVRASTYLYPATCQVLI